MKNIALITSLINLIVSMIIWIEFDSSTSQYQFVSEFNHLSFFHFNVGIDAISLPFVLITAFITPIALLSNHSSINKNLKLFLVSILLLETLQIALFTVLDLFLFYVFFESAKWFGKSFVCLQLSNSGDILKLIIPNYSFSTIFNWSNFWCKVKNYKINENEMGNHGTKSKFTELTTVNKLIVKEQRVYGSW